MRCRSDETAGSESSRSTSARACSICVTSSSIWRSVGGRQASRCATERARRGRANQRSRALEHVDAAVRAADRLHQVGLRPGRARTRPCARSARRATNSCSLSDARAAQVGLALEHQQRRRDALGVGQRRLLPEALEVGGRVAPSRAAASTARPRRSCGRRDLVGHAVGRHGRAEAVALADQPVRHEAAVGEARDAEARRVGEPLPHGPVDARELILGVGAAPVAADRLQPGAAVARRAARVGHQHARTRGGEQPVGEPGLRAPAPARVRR